MNIYVFEYDTWTKDNVQCAITEKDLASAVKKFVKNHRNSTRNVLSITENGKSVEHSLNTCKFKFH